MRTGSHRVIVAVIVAAMIASGCAERSSLERLSQARQIAADLLVQFTKAADASNRAVMADTDQASIAFAGEAEGARAAIQGHVGMLRPLLNGLGYADELARLEEFGARFAEYQKLDRQILQLAVENSNLKAQQLSFGPAQGEADACTESLEGLVPVDGSAAAFRLEALTATAAAAVREIQVLQAPHIAEPDDARMTGLEVRMAAAERAARQALGALPPLVKPVARPKIVAAAAALDRFMAINAQIIVLSRRNTNVRSLALSLNEKGKITRECEESLIALRDALARRGFGGTR